jgi:hypothetical protein
MTSNDRGGATVTDLVELTAAEEELAELCRGLLAATTDGDRLWRESARQTIVQFLLDRPESQQLTELLAAAMEQVLDGLGDDPDGVRLLLLWELARATRDLRSRWLAYLLCDEAYGAVEAAPEAVLGIAAMTMGWLRPERGIGSDELWCTLSLIRSRALIELGDLHTALHDLLDGHASAIAEQRPALEYAIAATYAELGELGQAAAWAGHCMASTETLGLTPDDDLRQMVSDYRLRALASIMSLPDPDQRDTA